jgi:uncharacterized membrane protein YjfL (UPF0719 family)
MKKYLPEIFGVFLFGVAFLVLFHQYYRVGAGWFNVKEIKNHEAVAVMLVSGGIGVIIGKYLGKI